MTEIDTTTDHGFETLTTPSTQGLQRLRAEVEAMKDAATMARGMAAGGFIPEHWLKDKSQDQAVAGMAAAILYGAELGLSAMRSLNELFIVRGKPAMYSRTMAALIRAAGYALEPVEESDTRCVWRGFRDGKWFFSEWTMERAEQAGYTSNALYRKEPKSMLRAKCITELARIAYQDVLLGLDYSLEELTLIDGVTVQRPVKKPQARGLAALREMADDAPKVGDNTPPEEERSGEADKPQEPRTADTPDPATIKQIIVAGKANNLNTLEDLFGDLSAYMGADIKGWDSITAEDAAAYLASLRETAKEQK